jgi:flagellar basal-body rod protein FlgG
MIDNNGYLVNPDGYFLQGENGPILVGQGQEPAVSENGGVFVGNELIDTIRLVSFEDKNVLRKEGDNLFSAPDGLAYESDEGVIKQGFVENSNVSAAQEMVDMITVYRAYESNQRILKMVDEIAGRAVNEIGGLR